MARRKADNFRNHPGGPIGKRMQRATTTLHQQSGESARLEAAIPRNPEGLGYGS